ncbi:hypothetical protein POTOM_057385 [Populus tomentosa]|uniref:Uncharacterized protein n=1 Tax=Populus tomentosa TaxID=118781 RepID=A0A8X7XXJ2_POPTO|nr:hypothetical protein POTOM_057385 [Populus tomentosa]
MCKTTANFLEGLQDHGFELERDLVQIVLRLINPSLQRPEPEYSSTPIPAPWPEQFHALLFINLSSTGLQITNLWYDWPRGRNVNIVQKQLSVLLYDTEWNNGTTFYYTLSEPHSCRIMVNDVGIPRPDFLDGISTHVITFEVGAVLLDDSVTQAPAYCFNQEIKNM